MTTIPTLTVHDIAMPALGYGTWELAPADAERGVAEALDLGYRHVDTAAMYGNEEAVGAGIRASGVDRDEVFLTTKVWRDDAAPDDVPKATEASLRRLGVDHLDLLLIHWPAEHIAPIEEVVEALHGVQERGLTRAIGVSNHTADQLRRAARAGPVATNQVEYHPLLAQDDVLGACRELDIPLTAYSPLARGEVMDQPALREIADEVGATPVQVALRWLLDHGDVAAIPKATSRDHIAANLDLDFTLRDEHRSRIADELPKDRRKVDPAFGPWNAA